MRARRAAHDAEYKLYKLWRQAALPVLAAAGRFCAQAAESVCAGLRAELFAAEESVPLLAAYERACGSCAGLASAYRGVLSDDSSTKVALRLEGKAAEIWDGILSVLQARVKLLDEAAGGEGENTVAASRDAVFENALQTLNAGFEASGKLFRAERGQALESAALGAFVGTGGFEGFRAVIINEVKERFVPRARKLFAPAFSFAVNGLKEAARKAEEAAFDELLQEEKGLLSSIIDIQIERIEEAYPSLSGAAAFEQLRAVYGGLCAGEIGAKAAAAGYSAGAEQPVGSIGAQNPAEGFAASLAAFKAAFDAEWDKMEQNGLNKLRYHLNKSVFEHNALAGEIAAAFRDVTAGGSIETLGMDIKDKQIIDGVLETIAIKTENIDDERERFAMDAKKLLAALAGGGSGQNREKAFADLCGALAAAGRDERKALAVLRKFAQGGCRGISNGASDKNGAPGKVGSRISSFMRDCVLSEISTFEEIMNYSVSRLRTSQNPQTAAFAAKVDEAASNVFALLTKYGIEIINPAPHEPFDGRSHEVLTAEACEGFSKGEVIKVLNKGYKRDGAVLTRANIVAAR